ncbi:MAG: macro domain-containing protein [Gemmatimonadota bacterium]
MSLATPSGLTLECVTADIADQPDMDAVVNAANAELRIGGGVAGAIHRAAGPGLEEETRSLAPIEPGQAVITGAHALPNRYVIHCLGPVYGVDEPADELLAACYRNALDLAARDGVRSIAFPAISTGAFGYPLEPAARIAIETILETHASESTVEHIRLVLYSDSDREVYERVLKESTA